VKSFSIAAIFELIAKLGIFLLSLIVARHFGPEDFGLWTLAQTMIFFVIIVVEFASQQTGVRTLILNIDRTPQDLQKALNTIVSFRIIGLSFCVLIGISFFLSGTLDFILLSSLIVYGLGHFFNFDFLYRALGYQLYAAVQNFILIFITVLIVFILSLLESNISDVILARSFVILLIFIMFFKYAKKKYLKVTPLNRQVISDLTENVQPNISAFLYVMAGAFFARVFSGANVFVVEYNLNNLDLGLFSAVSLFYIGFITIKGVITTLLYPNLCEKYNNGNYYEFVFKITKLSLLFSLVILYPISFYGDVLIKFIFGASYVTTESVATFKIYIYICIALSVGLLIPNSLHVTGRSKEFFIITLICALLCIGISFLLIPTLGIIGAAYATLTVELLVLISSGFYFLKGAKN
jgi:O-antigen/teichoic acid export membrane protein